MKTLAALATLGLFAGMTALPALPAAAQNQRIIEVYGNDACPSSGGEEIVVCNRRPERDRFRIPEALRRTEPEPGARMGGVALADSVSAASADMRPDSCSPVGSGGQSGCFSTQVRGAKAIRRQIDAEVPVIDD